MAAESCRQIARGDLVSILPLQSSGAPSVARTATVTYVGHVYIRLTDGSTYSVDDLKALRGNENTRIELVHPA